MLKLFFFFGSPVFLLFAIIDILFASTITLRHFDKLVYTGAMAWLATSIGLCLYTHTGWPLLMLPVSIVISVVLLKLFP